MSEPLRIKPLEPDEIVEPLDPDELIVEILAEIQQMHACLDALDDDRRLGWLWAAAWIMVGLTLGLIIAAIWL